MDNYSGVFSTGIEASTGAYTVRLLTAVNNKPNSRFYDARLPEHGSKFEIDSRFLSAPLLVDTGDEVISAVEKLQEKHADHLNKIAKNITAKY